MTDEYDDNEETRVLAQLGIAPARWWFGLGVQYLLAALLLFLALTHPPAEIAFQVLLVVIAALAVFVAERGRKARQIVIYVNRQRVWDSEGRELARLDQIKGVDRGAFAFKPSNGFLIRLHEAPGRAWVPGLWWRLGKSVGVGGSTPAGASKFMGEMIATVLKEREGLLGED